MELKKLMEHISIIPDYRQAWKVEHKLSDILLLTICAVISGAEGWEDIEDFGETHLDFLKKYGDFEWYSCSRYHCQSCILYQSCKISRVLY